MAGGATTPSTPNTTRTTTIPLIPPPVFEDSYEPTAGKLLMPAPSSRRLTFGRNWLGLPDHPLACKIVKRRNYRNLGPDSPRLHTLIQRPPPGRSRKILQSHY